MYIIYICILNIYVYIVIYSKFSKYINMPLPGSITGGFSMYQSQATRRFSCGNQEVVPVEQGSGNRKPVQKNPTCG